MDNRPGAGGNIGLGLVAKAAPDGYSRGCAAGALAANASLYAQNAVRPAERLQTSDDAGCHSVCHRGHPSVQVRTQAELITLARSKPDTLSIAHGGNGTAIHLAQLFQQMADVKLPRCRIGAQVQPRSRHQSGQVPLGVVFRRAGAHSAASAPFRYRRSRSQLPEVPTVAEAGLAATVHRLISAWSCPRNAATHR